jgi:hypothetical protein
MTEPKLALSAATFTIAVSRAAITPAVFTWPAALDVSL